MNFLGFIDFIMGFSAPHLSTDSFVRCSVVFVKTAL